MAVGVVIASLLWCSSIWCLIQSSNLYWRVLSVSWSASFSVIAIMTSTPMRIHELLIVAPFALVLVSFSVFLTPLQLAFGRSKSRCVASTATVLHDPPYIIAE